MIVFLTLCFAGIIFGLTKMKILPWNLATKLSPIGFALVMLVVLFIPMQWGAPAAPVVVFRQSVQIVPNVTGQVIEVPVKPNTPLKKGDVLFRIDPRPFQYALDAKRAALAEAEQNVHQLKANLAAAQAGVVQAQAVRDRSKQTYERYAKANQTSARPFSEQQVESRRLTYVANQAALDRAIAGEQQVRLAAESQIDGVNTSVARLRADVLKAQYDLEQTVVRAPMDGFVTNVSLRAGTRVAALPFKPAMAFIDTSETIIGAQVPQIFARHIKPGQSAEVTLKLFPGQVFQAKVIALLKATAQGQIPVTGMAPQAISASPGPFFVRLEFNDAARATAIAAGATGDVTIYTSKIRAAHVIRRVMIRMQAWMNYVMPF